MTDEQMAEWRSTVVGAIETALSVGEIQFETSALARGAKAKLIAARTAVPALLAEVERLGRLSRGLRAEGETYMAQRDEAWAKETKVRAEERERCAAEVRRFLVYDSQRAVSWHEVQDALDAIRALK